MRRPHISGATSVVGLLVRATNWKGMSAQATVTSSTCEAALRWDDGRWCASAAVSAYETLNSSRMCRLGLLLRQRSTSLFFLSKCQVAPPLLVCELITACTLPWKRLVCVSQKPMRASRSCGASGRCLTILGGIPFTWFSSILTCGTSGIGMMLLSLSTLKRARYSPSSSSSGRSAASIVLCPRLRRPCSTDGCAFHSSGPRLRMYCMVSFVNALLSFCAVTLRSTSVTMTVLSGL
mmetsp:Transcript_23789/g.61813  ORF Transcript_23789/g.61813 Transcript_23789/m.61813 type:complete len:236 (-) Transcript_23789:820-1527(-)